MKDLYTLVHRSLTVLFMLIVLTGETIAAPPQSISYQGYLNDTNALPVNATLNITFRLYDVDTAGTALWTDTQSVNVNNGLFSVELGSISNPLPKASFTNPSWLGVEVAADGEMTPRNALNATGNAFHAEDADTVGGLPPTTKGIVLYKNRTECVVTGNDQVSLKSTCTTSAWKSVKHSVPLGAPWYEYWYYDCAGNESSSQTPFTCPATVAGYLVSP